MKHIELDWHVVRDKVPSKIIHLMLINSSKQVVDIFTRDANVVGNLRRMFTAPRPTPQISTILIPHSRYGGIFFPIPIITDPHGTYEDPWISNLKKNLILFDQNYDITI